MAKIKKRMPRDMNKLAARVVELATKDKPVLKARKPQKGSN